MSKVGDFEAVRKDIVALLDQPEYDEQVPLQCSLIIHCTDLS